MINNYAIVSNGIVENVIVIDYTDTATIAHFSAIPIPQGQEIGIGYTYNGTTFAAPVIAPSTAPNPFGFITACKTALGGPTGILSLPAQVQSAISLTLSAIGLQNWTDVQIYITSMQTALGPTIYAEIKAAATANNIPVVL